MPSHLNSQIILNIGKQSFLIQSENRLEKLVLHVSSGYFVVLLGQYALGINAGVYLCFSHLSEPAEMYVFFEI